MKALFITFDPLHNGSKISLGHNITQRFYYIDYLCKPVRNVAECNDILSGRTLYVPFKNIFLTVSFLLWRSRDYDAIVTERNIFGVVGFLSKVIFGKKWITDLQDCPFKECTCFYRKFSIKWFLSFIKSAFIYRIIKYSDAIIVSFLKDRFLRYYKGSIEKVSFFKNAIPVDYSRINSKIKKVKDKNSHEISIFYVGANLHHYGINQFISLLEKYTESKTDVKFVLNTIVSVGIETLKLPKKGNLLVNNIKEVDNSKVIDMIEDSDICIVPFLSGSDIFETYPIKCIEMFVYGKKTWFSSSPGILDLFSSVKFSDIYYSDFENGAIFDKTLDTIIQDLENRVFESKHNVKIFDAKIKNKEIKEIYTSIIEGSI